MALAAAFELCDTGAFDPQPPNSEPNEPKSGDVLPLLLLFMLVLQLLTLESRLNPFRPPLNPPKRDGGEPEPELLEPFELTEELKKSDK